MFEWLRRLFTPPQAPSQTDFNFSSINITHTVTLNGETLEGDDAERVGKIVSEGADEIFTEMGKSFATVDELIARLNEEGRKRREKKSE